MLQMNHGFNLQQDLLLLLLPLPQVLRVVLPPPTVPECVESGFYEPAIVEVYAE